MATIQKQSLLKNNQSQQVKKSDVLSKDKLKKYAKSIADELNQVSQGIKKLNLDLVMMNSRRAQLAREYGYASKAYQKGMAHVPKHEVHTEEDKKKARLIKRAKDRSLKISQHVPQGDVEDILQLCEMPSVKWISTVGTLLYQIYTKSSKLEIVLSLTNLFTSISIKNTVKEHIEYIWNKLLKIFQWMSENEFISKIVDGLDNITDILLHFRELPIWKKIHKIIMYCLSFSLFEKANITISHSFFSNLTKHSLQLKFSDKFDFFTCIIDLIKFIITRGYQAWCIGSFEPFYLEVSSYDEWIESVFDIERKFAMKGNLSVVNTNFHKFFVQIKDTMSKGESILKLPNLDKLKYKILNGYLQRVKMIYDKLYNFTEAQQDRRTPFSMLIYGKSGIGKSTLKTIFATHFAKVMGLPVGAEYIYTRNSLDKFWSGFHTGKHTIVLDDIATKRDSSCVNGDESLNEVISIINQIAYTPNMASIEDKGNAICRPELVLGTTNIKYMQTYAHFNCPVAVNRRFPFIIEPKVKQEYVTDGFLDSAKIKEYNHDYSNMYPDYWTFTISKILVGSADGDRVMPRSEVICECLNIGEFLGWFNKAIISFKTNQDYVSQTLDNIVSLSLCRVCNLPMGCCSCSEIQDGIPSVCSGSEQDHIKEVENRASMDSHDINVYSDISVHPQYFTFMRKCGSWLLEFLYMCSSLSWVSICMTYCLSFKLVEYIMLMILTFCMPRDIVVKFVLRMAMSHVFKKIQKPLVFDNILKATSVMTLMYGMYTMYGINKRSKEVAHKNISHKLDTQTQGNIVALARERLNDYQYDNSNYELKISKASLSSGAHTELIDSKIATNIVMFEQYWSENGKNYIKSFKAVCLCGHIYLANNHTVRDIDSTLRIIHMPHTAINANVSMKFKRNYFKRYEDKDLLTFEFTKIPPKNDIRKYFVLQGNNSPSKGYYLQRDKIGEITRINVDNLRYGSPRFNIPLSLLYNPVYGHPHQITQRGDCGSLLVASYESYKGKKRIAILGIHLEGYVEDTLSCISSISLFQEDIMLLTTYYENTISSSTIVIGSKSEDIKLSSLLPQSHMRYCGKGEAIVYGSIGNNTHKPQSRVRDTVMLPALERRGVHKKHYAPIMTGYNIYQTPLRVMIHTRDKFDIDLLNSCVQSYISDIESQLHLQDYQLLQMYDQNVALNGYPGIAYVDSLNKNTSAGHPWRKPKKNFLIDDISDMYPNGVKVTPEIQASIDFRMSKYMKGKCTQPIFVNSIKDEVVSEKKFKNETTRNFAAMCFDGTVCMRMFYGSFIRFMLNHKFVFETAIGICAQSLEWEELSKFISRDNHFKNFIDGDFGKYDKGMNCEWIRAAFRVVHHLMSKGLYTEGELLGAKALAEDIIYPTMLHCNDIVQFLGTIPSGHVLTTPINSIINSIANRYVFSLCTGLSPIHYKQHCELITYGDDSIVATTHDKISYTKLRDAYASIGWEYTSGRKQYDSDEYVPLDHCIFLKRCFKYDKDIGHIVGPLEEDSLIKNLTMCVASDKISHELQCVSIISSVIREYFFHGKSKFEKMSSLLKEVALESQLQNYCDKSTFPSWNDLLLDYNERIFISNYEPEGELPHEILDLISVYARNFTCCIRCKTKHCVPWRQGYNVRKCRFCNECTEKVLCISCSFILEERIRSQFDILAPHCLCAEIFGAYYYNDIHQQYECLHCYMYNMCGICNANPQYILRCPKHALDPGLCIIHTIRGSLLLRWNAGQYAFGRLHNILAQSL